MIFTHKEGSREAAGGSFKKINLLISTTPALRATPPHLRGFAQKVGNGHAARSEICNRQSSGTQQRCAISSAIALADCTWLLDIGDRRKSANANRRCSESS